MRALQSVAIVTTVLGMTGTVLAYDVPSNDGFVTQYMSEKGAATVLTSEQEASLEGTLSAYEKQTSNEIAIFITDSLHDQPIEDVANTVFRAWGVGKNDKNNGILMVLAAADHKVRIEVGYGLEGAVPDIVAKGVIDTDMTPQFQEGKYFEGLTAGVDALIKHIGGEYTADRYADSGSDTFPFLLFVAFILFQIFGAWMASTKSWWLGGVLGGVFGLIAALAFNWWLSIPPFILFGLLVDYVLSKNASRFGKNRRGRWGGGFGGFGGGMGGSGGGGFGGFGGGSSGGGGASGSW